MEVIVNVSHHLADDHGMPACGARSSAGRELPAYDLDEFRRAAPEGRIRPSGFACYGRAMFRIAPISTYYESPTHTPDFGQTSLASNEFEDLDAALAAADSLGRAHLADDDDWRVFELQSDGSWVDVSI